MVNIGADHVNKLLSMSRAIAAQGAGLNAAAYGAPYPGSTTTIVTEQPKQKSGMIGAIAGVLLGATGLGAAGGALYALNQATGSVVAKPATTAPQNFKIKVGFDEEKGFQFGEPKQVK